MGKWGTGTQVEWHLRWLVRGAGRYRAQGPFDEANLHLYRGEQREHIGLGQVANWGRRHVRQCIPLWQAATVKSRRIRIFAATLTFATVAGISCR
jgi:hypothetical protein